MRFGRLSGKLDRAWFIAFDYNASYRDNPLGKLKNEFESYNITSSIMNADTTNLEDVFKDILYAVNAELSEAQTEDGRLNISGIVVTNERPLVIRLTWENIEGKEEIYTYTDINNTDGIIKQEEGSLWLYLDALKAKAQVDSLEGINVEIEYYTN